MFRFCLCITIINLHIINEYNKTIKIPNSKLRTEIDRNLLSFKLGSLKFRHVADFTRSVNQSSCVAAFLCAETNYQTIFSLSTKTINLNIIKLIIFRLCDFIVLILVKLVFGIVRVNLCQSEILWVCQSVSWGLLILYLWIWCWLFINWVLASLNLSNWMC